MKRPNANAPREELWKYIQHFENQIKPLADLITIKFPEAIEDEGAIATAMNLLRGIKTEVNEDGTYGEGSDYEGDIDA